MKIATPLSTDLASSAEVCRQAAADFHFAPRFLPKKAGKAVRSANRPQRFLGRPSSARKTAITAGIRIGIYPAWREGRLKRLSDPLFPHILQQ